MTETLTDLSGLSKGDHVTIRDHHCNEYYGTVTDSTIEPIMMCRSTAETWIGTPAEPELHTVTVTNGTATMELKQRIKRDGHRGETIRLDLQIETDNEYPPENVWHPAGEIVDIVVDVL